MNSKQLSEIIPFSVFTIQKWCRKGLIPHYKVNGTFTFLPSEIQEWLETKKVEAKGDKIKFQFVRQIRVK